MKRINRLLGFVLAPVFFAACYEDKGNYEYRTDVHDIAVTLKRVHSLHKKHEKMTYTITPEVTTVDGDKSSLEYLWLLLRADGRMDTLSVVETATLEIDPQSPDYAEQYSLRFYVTDTRTNGVSMAPTRVELIKPYAYSWLVLHEDDNHAELGTVEYLSEGIRVTPRAYSDEQGKSMVGLPVNLTVVKNDVKTEGWGLNSFSQIFVTTTDTIDSGLLDQTNRFKKILSWEEMIHPDQLADIDFANMSLAGGDEGLLACSKGNVFRNRSTSLAMFRMNPASSLTGAYEISHVITNFGTFGLGYDRVGCRFMALVYGFTTWNGLKVPVVRNAGTFSPVANKAENAVDPANIPADHQIIRLLNGYRYSTANPGANHKYSVYAYALAPGGKSHVYVLRYYGAFTALAASGPSLPYHYEFDTPAGVTESTPMTTSFEYNNILFYAHGNKVYRLDFSTGATGVIYTHEDAGAEIVSLKMAVEGYTETGINFTGSATYGHPYARCLGVGVNTSDGKGEIVVLQLNTAGKVDEDKKYPSTQVYKGFGKITGIDFI